MANRTHGHRPLKSGVPGQAAKMSVNVSWEMKNLIDAAAAASGRTQGAEIEHRLRWYTEHQQTYGGARGAAFFTALGGVVQTYFAGEEWLDDPAKLRAVRELLIRYLYNIEAVIPVTSDAAVGAVFMMPIAALPSTAVPVDIMDKCAADLPAEACEQIAAGIAQAHARRDQARAADSQMALRWKLSGKSDEEIAAAWKAAGMSDDTITTWLEWLNSPEITAWLAEQQKTREAARSPTTGTDKADADHPEFDGRRHFGASWQLARLRLLVQIQREPSEREIAECFARDAELKYLCQLHTVPQTSSSILEYRARLIEERQAAREADAESMPPPPLTPEPPPADDRPAAPA
jgi:hypothetical protein